MSIINECIRNEKEYRGILENALLQTKSDRPHPMTVTGMCDGASASLYISLSEDIRSRTGRGLLIIVPDEKVQSRLKNAFDSCGKSCYVYPYRDFLFHNIICSHEYEHERLSVLSAVANGNYDAVIATPDAALQYTMPREVLSSSYLKVESDKCYEINEIVSFLEKNGYVRADMVDSRGQYSVRGGILDIFSPYHDSPVRIDFFDNEIEQMGFFDVLSQRRTENTDSLVIIPAREVIYGRERAEELKTAIQKRIKKLKDESVVKALSEELECFKSGLECNFTDKYISIIYPQKECLIDYFSDGGFCIVHEYAAVCDRAKAFDWQNGQTLIELGQSYGADMKQSGFAKTLSDLEYYIDSRPTLISETFLSSMNGRKLSGVYSFITRQTVSYFENFDLLCEDLSSYIHSKYRIIIMTESEQRAKSLMEMLHDRDIASAVGDGRGGVPSIGLPFIVYGYTVSGYELTSSKCVCLSLIANSGLITRNVYRKKKKGGKNKSAQEKILSYAELEEGDYVVHNHHGIGRYIGMHSLTLDGITKDFIKIQYAGSDMLYLPCDQLDSIAKYIGAKAEDGTLKLSKMGGTEWQKAKLRVKGAAKSMAKELIALYAERLRKKGFAFDKDDKLQSEFESGFEYDETDGQLAAVNDIKSDMEQSFPMDRLLCGDVGFGKTEVAIRAAFKAVCNSKQVAILVPTTVLALQHFQTISTRMRGFPVKTAMLSRFISQKEQKENIRRLRRGEIDIVVGTHRLLSKDLAFKDLGLVIIDEEQRFGVAHKEKLKQMTKNVDVLTLTATPIPRTLNMAMSGIRDMSVLEEAPGDRMPVQSYVLEYDELIISEAIKKELRRGGQVFYLHNNIESIDYAARRVAAMVPDARIAVAHGKTDKETLSDLWRSLVMGEIDVFISTTIIESGVDVPNANTLIIENADKLGLSQLHQIRGRVGRSSRRAYAYFTFPKGKVLTEIATKRLSAIREYTEFGAGFKVALRDLEIRGAGNLLGSEQHGHMETVGYDMYMKLLNEAILEEKGEQPQKKVECAVELNINAFIPEKYVKTSAQRIDAYKKIAGIENEEDMRDITDELLDRYGDIPSQTLNLLKVSLLRAYGSRIGISKIERKSGNVLIYPFKMDASVWAVLAAEDRGKLLLNMGTHPYVSYRLGKGEDVCECALSVLKKYDRLANVPASQAAVFDNGKKN